MEPWSFDVAGRFEEHTIASDALRDNPLGDPSERPLWVYVPPGYDDDPEARFASVYMIQGLTGQLDMAEPLTVPTELPGARRRPVRARRRARRS